MFELTTWHASFADFFLKLRHYTVIGKQLFISNDRNRVRWVVLGLLQDGACIDLFENLSVNSLKGDLSNATTFKLPLFSLDNTFKGATVLKAGRKYKHDWLYLQSINCDKHSSKVPLHVNMFRWRHFALVSISPCILQNATVKSLHYDRLRQNVTS
jgi:hypothetical protein